MNRDSLLLISFSFFSTSIYLQFLAASIASGQVLSLLRLAQENEFFFNLELINLLSGLVKKSTRQPNTGCMNEQEHDCCVPDKLIKLRETVGYCI